MLRREWLSPKVCAAMGNHMASRNSPGHTRLRRLVTAAFTRRRIDQLGPRIQHITDELIDAMANEAQIDLIAAFAYPLPITVICELLCVPQVTGRSFMTGRPLWWPAHWPTRTPTAPRSKPSPTTNAMQELRDQQLEYLSKILDTPQVGEPSRRWRGTHPGNRC